MTTDIEKLIEILNAIKGTVKPDSNLLWTHYNDPQEIILELEKVINELRNGDFKTIEKLKVDFLPTCTFQELAISNGWGDYYLELADKFDEVYKKLKT